MAKIQIDTMADFSEIIHYDTPEIPLYIQRGLLSNYPDMRAVCHWHDDIELIQIISGEMNYYINGQTVLLKKDDTLLINSKEMHYGYSFREHECEFTCILFHPSLLSANRNLFEQYVAPILDNQRLPYLWARQSEQLEITQLVRDILAQKEAQDSGYEINVIGMLYTLWASICRLKHILDEHPANTLPPDVQSLRAMVSFIHTHYKESITLEDIANSATICRSKCCSVFQQQIQQRPFDFLNNYRLQMSADLLKNTTMPITEIALECGFNNPSYYSKLFLRQHRCTPREFRKSHANTRIFFASQEGKKP